MSFNIEQDRETVTEWLNEAHSITDTSERIQYLTKAQEFLIHKAPKLLPELLSDVLGFAADRNSEVKKFSVGFIEEICKQDEQYIPSVIANLHMLLCDESVQVQKRVIQASSSIYRSMMQWLSRAPTITDEIERAWNGLNRIKVEIVNMIDSDNDGVRTHSIKFLEVVVLLQTYPEAGVPRKGNDFSLEDIPLTLKIARRRKLEEEANHIFMLLVKFHGSPHISSVNLMACMGSLCTIAKSRSEFMGRVVAALEALHSNLPPTLSHSQVSSVKKHLKLQLLNILRHPASYDVRPSVVSLLAELGCSPQEIARATPKGDEKRRLPKRPLEHVTPVVFPTPAKKPKIAPDLESKPEEMRRQAVELNYQFVMDNMNINNVIQIVLSAIVCTPNVMPPFFAVEYSKAVTSNGIVLKDVARMLAEMFTDANVGPGTVKAVAEPALPSVSQMLTTLVAEPAKDNDNLEGKIEKLNREMKASRAAVKQQRVKTLKLAEVTRPLAAEIRQNVLVDAVRRILQSERAATRSGVAEVRYKIVTKVASSFCRAVRDSVLEFLVEDLRSHLDLALAWLYEEYSLMQGFNRMPIMLRREERPDESYNRLLCALVAALQVITISEGASRDRDVLLSRVFLEAPMITDQALEMLRMVCEQPDRCSNALSLLHDLVLRRPPRSLVFLRALLQYTGHEETAVREESIARVLSLYGRSQYRKVVEAEAMRQLEMLTQPQPPDALFDGRSGRCRRDTGTGSKEEWTDELNRACLSLYLALLPYNEALIHELSNVYTQTGADTKRTILRLLDQPIKSMGNESAELLTLIERCPKGAETLVTRVIHILAERGMPSHALVSRVRELYQSRVSDVRFLIPVLAGLTKKEVIAALPKLIKLNPVVVKEVFNRLLGLHGTDSPVTPAELLTALHLIDPTKAELKAVMKATSLCFAEKQVYTQEVLAIVMQQLMEISPLPTLLMRTVIQSLSLYPRLTGFIMNILQRLILKQVWRQKVVWEGFVKCCQRTRPQSFQVMLQLPPPQLAEALIVCPDMRQPLLEHVQAFSDAQRAHIPASTMEALTGQPLSVAPVALLPAPVAMPDDPTNDSATAKDMIVLPTHLLEPLPPGMD